MAQTPPTRPPPVACRRSSFDGLAEHRRQASLPSELSARLKHQESLQSSISPLSTLQSQEARVSFQPGTTGRHIDNGDTQEAIPTLDGKEEAQYDVEARTLMPSNNRWKTFFLQEVAHNHYLEGQLLALTVATGVIDAVTNFRYNVFVSKQTGNTVYLALYAVELTPYPGLEKNVAVSIGFFVLGSIFFGHLGHFYKQRRRIWLLANNAIQCALVSIAVGLSFHAPHSRSSGTAAAIIALLSFSSGGQISLAVCVKLPELNTTMITGSIIQLATDPKIFKLHNPARNRRILFYMSLLVGAFIGAGATARIGFAYGILLHTIIKILVGFSFLFNYGMVHEERQGSGTVTPLTKILWGD